MANFGELIVSLVLIILTSSFPSSISLSSSHSIIGLTHLVCFFGCRLLISEQLLERSLWFLMLLRTFVWSLVVSSQPRFSCTGASPWLVIPSSWLMMAARRHCQSLTEFSIAFPRSPGLIVVFSSDIVQHVQHVIASRLRSS